MIDSILKVLNIVFSFAGVLSIATLIALYYLFRD